MIEFKNNNPFIMFAVPFNLLMKMADLRRFEGRFLILVPNGVNFCLTLRLSKG
jgi:hypothetical protein